MAFAYRIDSTRRLVLLTPPGPPTLQDWIDVIDRLIVDPRIEPGFGVISDRRHLSTPPTTEYVRDSIKALCDRRDYFRWHRVAILSGNLATYGMGRMAEMLAENHDLEFRVFTDETEAILWASGETS
jgi:hypothetical protein